MPAKVPPVALDQDPDPSELVQRAALQPAIAGDEPFVWWAWLGGPCEPRTLLPPGTVVLRTSTSGNGNEWQALLARGEGFHILIDARADTRVTVTSADPDLAAFVGTGVQDRAPRPVPDGSRVAMRFWYEKHGSVEWTYQQVEAPEWTEIARNYSRHTHDQLEQLVATDSSMLDAAAGRLLVWHGPPGTGKTFAVRALLRAWSSWCEPQYLYDLDRMLDEPNYLLEVLLSTPRKGTNDRRKWKVVVAEDIDRCLSGHHGPGAPPLDRLLNATDGLLGQSASTLVLLTMNGEPHHLNPALLRPGRCLSLTEFLPFTSGEAESWLGTGIPDSVDRLPLAELFAWRGDIATTTTRQPKMVGQYL